MTDDALAAELAEYSRLNGWPEGDPRRRHAGLVQGLLADLDRQWQLPPTALAAELARSVVEALAGRPDVLAPVARALASEVARQLRAEGALALVTDLEARGVRLRAEGGRLLAGPKAALTPEVRRSIRENRGALLAAVS